MNKFLLSLLFALMLAPIIHTEAATTKTIEPNHVFTITVSDQVDRATLENAVSLQCDCDVDYTFSYVNNGQSKQQQIHLVPSKPLTVGETYEVVISQQLKNTKGQALKKETRQPFTVKAVQNKTAPIREDALANLKQFNKTQTATLELYSGKDVTQSTIETFIENFQQSVYPVFAEAMPEVSASKLVATVLLVSNKNELQNLEYLTGESVFVPSFNPKLNMLILNADHQLEAKQYTQWVAQNVYRIPANSTIFPYSLAQYMNIEYFMSSEHHEQRAKSINLNQLKNETAFSNYSFNDISYTVEMLNHYVNELNKPLGEILKTIPYAGIEHAWAQTLDTEPTLLSAYMIRKLYENSNVIFTELDGKYGQVIGTTNPALLAVSEKTYDMQLTLLKDEFSYLYTDIQNYRMFLISCKNNTMMDYYVYNLQLNFSSNDLKSRPVISLVDKDFVTRYNLSLPDGVSYSEEHGIVFHVIDDSTMPTATISQEINALVEKHYN